MGLVYSFLVPGFAYDIGIKRYNKKKGTNNGICVSYGSVNVL